MNIGLLAPAGLFAAISLAVVLVLHIRRQTPPPRTFPSLRFWKPSETSEANRHRLRRPPITLPLILQLLIALLVTLALARPAVSGAFGGLGGRTSPVHQIVLVDGSTSMLARNEGEQRTRFERARQEALTIVDDWQAGDVDTVMFLGTTTETRSASNAPQVAELREWMKNTKLPGGQADINETLRLARNLGLDDRDNEITLITDTALQVDPDIAATVNMPIKIVDTGDGASSANVAVTSIGAKPIPGTDNQVSVTFAISNFSPTEADVPWFVEADGTEIAANTAFLRAGASTQVNVNLPRDAGEVTASIDFSDALYDDNRAMLPLENDRLGQLDILLLSDAPSKLLRALQVLPGASVDLQPASIPGIRDLARGYDLVVFEGTAPPLSELPETPMLFVQPPTVKDLFTISGSMNAPLISTIDALDPAVVGVDLSGVTFGPTPTYSIMSSETPIVTGSDGATSSPLVWRGLVDTNPYVALAFSIAESNISQRVAFPILVATIVESLTAATIPQSVAIGDPVELATADDVASIEVTLPNQTVSTVSVAPTDAANEGPDLPAVITFTGLGGRYVVTSKRGDGSVASEGSFVVNTGHPQESNLASNPDLANVLQSSRPPADASTATSARGNELWLALAAFALIVMLFEWVIAGGYSRKSLVAARGTGG